MINYLNLLRQVRTMGLKKSDRTGTGTLSVFAPPPLTWDLSEGFPAVTTKKLWFHGFLTELLWFLSGSTNIAFLHHHGVKIWDEWADENGDIGRCYGAQWRKWEQFGPDGKVYYIDQIANVIKNIKQNPDSRRHIVSAWNVADLDTMGLPPCHMFFQFWVGDHKRLSCHMYQRSADLFLGVPFNISSYALLTCMVAQVTGHQVGDLTMSFGDAHIYLNHLEQVDLQLKRVPKKLPQLYTADHVSHIDDFRHDDFILDGYEHHPAIKAEIAV